MNAAATLMIPEAQPPTYPTKSILGALPELRQDPLALFERMAALGPSVRFRAGPTQCVLAAGPDEVEQVLVRGAKNYGKQSDSYNVMRMALGNGLVTSDGEAWKANRRIIQPAFHRHRIAGFAALMAHTAETTVASWQLSDRAAVRDVHRDMMKLTLKIASLTLLSRDVDESADEIGDALEVALPYLEDRFMTVLNLPSWVPTRANRTFRQALAALDRIVAEIIAERRRGASPKGDVLDMLLEARDEETGLGMSDQQLRDEVMTLFTAGHETTANALTWTLYLLALHADVAADVRRELEQTLGGRPARLEDLPSLALMDRVVKESMRLYPPIAVLERSVHGEDDLGGHRVRPGQIVVLSPWATHRLPSVWPDPERFDPSRFTPENEAHRHRHAYFPFSGGSRKCLGDTFAMIEVRLVLATLLQRAQFTLDHRHAVVPETRVTLRPRGGMPMRVQANGLG